ncbi:MAG: hypothetical protein ABIP55_01635 [Tepidisphaeraceae bacterium]
MKKQDRAANAARTAKTNQPVGGIGPAKLRNDQLEAANPVQPANPTKGPPQDDPTKRLGNHNNLPRRDPSGARGNRDARRSHQTRAEKTRR